MLNALRALARFCSESIGWNRIGFIVSINIIAIALWVLVRILRDIDIEQVIAALKSAPPRDLALSGLFVTVSYLTLTFYNLFALRTIGEYHIPYRIAALSSFTSYAIGHNVGASALPAARESFLHRLRNGN